MVVPSPQPPATDTDRTLTPLQAEAKRLSEMFARQHDYHPALVEHVMQEITLGVIVIVLMLPMLFGDTTPLPPVPPSISTAQADVAGWVYARIWAYSSMRAIGVINPRTGASRPLWPTLQELRDPLRMPRWATFHSWHRPFQPPLTNWPSSVIVPTANI